MTHPIKKSISLTGHATSLSLEAEFWEALQKIAQDKKTSLRQIIMEIDNNRTANLSSAVRVYILKELQKIIDQK